MTIAFALKHQIYMYKNVSLFLQCDTIQIQKFNEIDTLVASVSINGAHLYLVSRFRINLTTLCGSGKLKQHKVIIEHFRINAHVTE